MRISTYIATTSFFGIVLSSTAFAQLTTRVSVDSGGAQADQDSYAHSISADGRYVAFSSLATNLVGGDTNILTDVFVHDRQSGTTERVSVISGGGQGNHDSNVPSISADGRFVAFHSLATNLVGADGNGSSDIFVHDRQSGTTELVSVSSGGTQGNDHSRNSSISADGRYVAFHSDATNLVGGDTNGGSDVFVHDRQGGTTERMSVSSGGAQGDSSSFAASISADGRYVAFDSDAANLVGGDTNVWTDIFVHDRQTGTTERVSVSSGGTQGDSGSFFPALSADGRYVAFWSWTTNLVGGDTNGCDDIFVHDRQSGTTERASVSSGGAQANLASDAPSISADGRYVAFRSGATNLVSGDTNGFADIFVHDRQSGTTERVSVDSLGAQANGVSGFGAVYFRSISSDGRYVAFNSAATNLVGADTNGFRDIFVRDRNGSGFTSLCDPGAGGVQACPCSNPPSGAGRGCNNSAGTGGAILSASGIAYLSVDSLVFTTSGERMTATSILLQGTTSTPAGIIYGQGIRCVSGSLKRLFLKSAVGGSITAPNFGGGDPTVSARSAARGDVIAAGQSRWYLVFYRDSTVLGGCPAASTFNTTQSGRVDWSL